MWYEPRRGAYKASKENYKYLGSTEKGKISETSPSEGTYWVSYTLKAKLKASDFPRILMPYEDPSCLIERSYKWHSKHPLSKEEFHRRLRLCQRLIGYDPDVDVSRQISQFSTIFMGYNSGRSIYRNL
jgi:hypothetical protein